jgi:hypothetical protein
MGFLRHLLFLRWWLLAMLIATGATVCYQFNVFHTLWDMDNTKLSFVIIGLFTGVSLWVGGATWRAGSLMRLLKIPARSLKRVEYVEDTAWFMSDVVLTLGMIGTVCGFILMLMSGFEGIDASDPKTLQVMLAKMSAGMSTALFTTLAGLVASVLLKLQSFNLTQGLDRMRKSHLHEVVGGELDETKKLSL